MPWTFKRDASPRLEHQDIPPISNLGTSNWGDVTTKSHDTYIAGPIRHNEVRLMVLQPGVFDDHIFVSMITVDDADLESEKVPYIAPSYSCRNEQCDSVIFVQEDPESPQLKTIENGIAMREAKTFKVTPNVWQALRHPRKEESKVIMWVNAVCIDHSTIEEKNSQMNKLARIYSRAYNVAVWLGSNETNIDEPIAARAMAFIMDLNLSLDILGDLNYVHQ
jgi:hypothetical protein